MQLDHYTYHLAGHYLPALINGDFTGLSDQEEAELNTWIDSLSVSGHFDVISEESDFRLCDICELHADCYEVRLYFQTQEATQ
jgi:hypothetical protein